jgi:hypothetical protein
MEAAGSSESLIPMCQTKLRHFQIELNPNFCIVFRTDSALSRAGSYCQPEVASDPTAFCRMKLRENFGQESANMQ